MAAGVTAFVLKDTRPNARPRRRPVLLVPPVVAGTYGMNFRYMPELGWRGGHWTALGAMVLLMLVMWMAIRMYLRKK